MDQETKKEFAKVNKKLDKADQKFDKIDQEFANVNQKLDKMDKEFRKLGVEFEHFRHDVKFIVETLDATVNLPPTQEEQLKINQSHEMRIKTLETRVKAL